MVFLLSHWKVQKISGIDMFFGLTYNQPAGNDIGVCLDIQHKFLCF